MEAEARQEGRVTAILSKYKIATNLGSQDEIQVGDRLEIYEQGPSLADPQTGEDLGALEVVKGEVRVESVQENQCVAATEETTETVSSIALLYGLSPTTTVKRLKPLPVDETEIDDLGVTPQIYVNDRVRKIPPWV